MGLWTLVLREFRHRVGNVLLGTLAVAVGVGAWAGAVVLLRGHDARTELFVQARRAELEDELSALKEEMRKATLELSFNLLILPKGQDLRAWHADGVIDGSMPQEYVQRLAQAGIVTVRHFLPIVQRRVWWEEKGRRIILVGSRGEVANLHMSPRKPLVQPVPPGTIVLGHELHRSLGLDVGDKVTLMKREFTVHRCHEERGSLDDITAWIHLDEAQELFDLKGRLHAILALECLCAGMPGVEKFRVEVHRALPDTEVIEFRSKALARADARFALGKEAKAALQRDEQSRIALRGVREQLAAVTVPLIMALSAVALAALAAVNVRQRLPELALLRVLGLGSVKILVLVLLRYALAAVPGAIGGCLAGVLAGKFLASWLDPLPLPGGAPLLSCSEAALAVGIAVLATAAATWLPALNAARKDPAIVLNRL